MEYALSLKDLESLHHFAAGLAAGLRAGDVLALSGPVGAGKTTLARMLVTLLTGDDQASSPSFVLWQRYEGAVAVNHLDLHRIEDPRELRELGLEEAFEPAACTIVEWPERAPGLLPPAAVHLRLDGAGDDPRTLLISKYRDPAAGSGP